MIIEIEAPSRTGSWLGPQEITTQGVTGSVRPQRIGCELQVTTVQGGREATRRGLLTFLPPTETSMTRQHGIQDPVGSVGMMSCRACLRYTWNFALDARTGRTLT